MERTLNSGYSIPMVGLGTFRARGEDVYRAVLHALEAGYRHIDTAVAYKNEEEVGRALADSSVPREEVFVTTKIWNSAHTKEATTRMIDASLANLGTDYIDLLLMHWPWTYERNAAVYAAMEEAADAGKVRTLGISNFHIHHLDALLQTARVVPAVNQVECHVHLQNTRLQDYLESKGIAMEAYAPFKSDKIQDVLENETLRSIGDAHGTSPTQVSLRWMVQRGIIALPKSVTPARITENLQVFDFELTDEEMHAIRKLNRAERTFPEPDNFDPGFLEL